MNISKLEPIWSYELDEYMEERYGIDISKVICETILEAEDAEKVLIMEQIAQKMLKHKIKNIPEKN